LLGIGGATLLEELGITPDVYHLNEAHGLSAAFKVFQRLRCTQKLRERFVFTTHTPEEAGNETTNFELLHEFSFFCGLSMDEARGLTGIGDELLNHTLAGLRMSRVANGVSKLHGEVARQMWEEFPDICPIHHVTNAQNKKFWVDPGLERARLASDVEHLRNRKRELKARLFAEVADQTGKLFDPNVLTIVWARRFAAYKRADLILRELGRFLDLINNAERPVQMIWAGKPYPTDYQAIEIFNNLVQATAGEENAAVLVRHELALSKLLKDGADIWLNTPIVHREASGTSGMTAAMNAALNLSTDDGWVREFGHDRHNCFLIPVASPSLTPEVRDRHDMNGFYQIMEDQVLPSYYGNPDHWWQMVLNSMNEVVPFFDADRMAEEYYERIY
jgi:starch phosphorylase